MAGVGNTPIKISHRQPDEMMFVIGTPQDLTQKKRILLYGCFVDFTRSYDSINWPLPPWNVLAIFSVVQNDFVHSWIPREHIGNRAVLQQRMIARGPRPMSKVHGRAAPALHLRSSVTRDLNGFSCGGSYHGCPNGSQEDGKRGGGRRVKWSEGQPWWSHLGYAPMPKSSHDRLIN